MAQPAAATENNEARRTQMLRAAAELIVERGFGETRIADVAQRAQVSAALIIYYFGTRERLLIDAMLYTEQALGEAISTMLDEVPTAKGRLELLTRWICSPSEVEEVPGSWGLWFDIWSLAFRNNPEVRQARCEQDARYRAVLIDVVRQGQRTGEIPVGVDARHFAQMFQVLTDGLSIQVALEDPDLPPARACELAMDFASRELSLS